MSTTLILVGLFIFLVLGFLVLLFFMNLKRESFIASDGSIFKSQSDLDLYQDLLIKTKPLFSSEEASSTSKSILGYDKIFLTKLKTEGFRDLNNLIKYRSQFKTLSSLLNP